MVSDLGREVQVEPLRDLEVAYRSAGEGRRLALIHGLAQDHRMWQGQQQHLKDFSTLAYDVRGHGATTIGQADGTLAQLGEDLISFLERFGPATCVGFSLGGTVALWAGAERPDLVEGVVAIATSSVVGSAAAAGLARRIELFESGDAEAIRAAVLDDTRVQLTNSDVDLAAVVDARIEAIGDRKGYINGARAMAGMHSEPLNDRLTKISVPVLVVTGEHDVVCPRKAADIMLQYMPEASFEELKGLGHLVTDDDSSAVSAVLRHWLTQNGS